MERFSHWAVEFCQVIPAYADTLSIAKQKEFLKTLSEFEAWCASNDTAVTISQNSYDGFGGFLRKKEAKWLANRKLRYLYSIGIRGADRYTRDYLFENCPDRRKLEAVLVEPWWPNIPRILAKTLDIPERRRVIAEMDNFFRWQQRTADLSLRQRLDGLFLSKSISARTKYSRLGRLCRGLDAVLPGDQDLTELREEQRRLYTKIWPHAEPKQAAIRKIPEVEMLIASHRDPTSLKPCADATKQILRAALNLHHDILVAAGQDLAFDKSSLDLFADYAFAKNDLFLAEKNQEINEAEQQNSWCSRTVALKCEALGRFVVDPELKRDWYRFAAEFRKTADRSEPKRKEIYLAANPTDLNDLFTLAKELLRLADCEVDVQKRYGIFTVIGALGILLFYPLRKSDLLALVIGKNLTREHGRWVLYPGLIRKPGLHVGPLILAPEAGVFLDACLLRGRRREYLSEAYRRAQGRPLLKSPRRSSTYESGAFSTLFRRWAGLTPHLLRTLWCDELVARGADRIKISLMLQHKSLISQTHYEVLAGKIRMLRAVEALRQAADNAMAN